MSKIAHLTSVHQRYDTRIFLKMCSSLAKNKNYNVFLVVADGLGNEIKNNVNIIDIGKRSNGKFNRILKMPKKILHKAIELEADIYHIHDPELLTIALNLKKNGAKVIFDSHENVTEQILSKEYIPSFLRNAISKIYSLYESYVCKKIDAIVTATPHINDKFLKINKNSVNINNYPILGELSNDILWSEKKDEICYVGGITKIRGIIQILEAMKYVDYKLNLVGSFDSDDLKNIVEKTISELNGGGYDKVKYFGFLNRKEVSDVLSVSKIGLVTLTPIINYINSLPIKLFEYMSAGLPVIASNFPLWIDIVEKNKCGICVDPLNSKEIANAINFIIQNPEEAEKMAQNGKMAVLEKYNWDIEEKKLFQIYDKLAGE
ncbi:glycosyltransferase family 4 protein [Campylobacter gastrosuis]|uniref:Glycosyltransferase family 4 protein n=1 Tax=Campylobacter gastrosuis TaxID=2974576 RepID=A0ABT7HNE6_9BACT|nr:glycosyltransferase family 4 protein [Campylobacter gastrosuis]MDL0088300.1 glycosyltransferase family 4 protein [Campylobacter gastrosuis]